MRLLSKTSLLIITVSIFIFLVGDILFFNIAKQMIHRHVNMELMYQMHRIIKIAKESDSIDTQTFYSDEVEISEVDKSMVVKPSFSDTVLYSTMQQQFIPHRALKFTYSGKSSNQIVTIYKSLLSSDKLIERITISSIAMVFIFIAMIYILNRFIFEKVWAVFFENLKRVEKYDVKSKSNLVLEDTEIEEFRKLNAVHLKMVERIQSDFVSLKELTANTSHEIQTPLAIIKSKAEILLQSENLTESELSIVDTILNTAERLSKLNQSLLLITKIENNQFAESEKVKVNQVVEKFVQNFGMLLEAGQYEVSTALSDFEISINPILLDVLIANLLKNAIVHGQQGGILKIVLENKVLKIINSGKPLSVNPDDLFKRFVKASQNTSSSGLGLEIVRKICEFYDIQIQYNYQNNLHSFSINFAKLSLNI
jgi:signal transduction histidine kinase